VHSILFFQYIYRLYFLHLHFQDNFLQIYFEKHHFHI